MMSADEARVQASLGSLPKTKVVYFYTCSQNEEESKNPDLPLKRLASKITNFLDSSYGKIIVINTSITTSSYADSSIITIAAITYNEM